MPWIFDMSCVLAQALHSAAKSISYFHTAGRTYFVSEINLWAYTTWWVISITTVSHLYSTNPMPNAFPQHYICWSELPVPRIAVTFSIQEVEEIEKDCSVYRGRMERIAKHSAISREEQVIIRIHVQIIFTSLNIGCFYSTLFPVHDVLMWDCPGASTWCNATPWQQWLAEVAEERWVAGQENKSLLMVISCLSY